MLSVLIPIYNYDAFPLAKEMVRQAEKESVDFEILCYDDGSTLFEKENKRIGSLKNVAYKKFSSNIGRTAIRQKLASDASFDWLLFVDADMMPKENFFLKNYIKAIGCDDFQVAFGGYSYSNDIRPSNLRLRYGRNREEVDVKNRNKLTYNHIFFGNLLMSKRIFNELFDEYDEDIYGEDIFLASKLKAAKIPVTHLDNSAYHLGLEKNIDYIHKIKTSAHTLSKLYLNPTIDVSYSKLIRCYLFLKKYNLITITRLILLILMPLMYMSLRILGWPIFFIDSMRLYHFLKKIHHGI